MLDAPLSGRLFFEQVIRDNLDAGRPDQVSLIFDRRILRGRRLSTPSRWRTRVITDGVTPSLHVDYKHTTIKQYHKQGRALRTETTINDTRDFEIGKRLVNLPALREIGFSANRRLLRVQRLDHDPITGTATLHAITEPVTTDTGTRVPGLRLGQQRSQALLTALPIFRLQPAGFRNAEIHPVLAQLRGLPARSADHRTNHLRPAPTTHPRPHRTRPTLPPIPRHRPRPAHRPDHQPSHRPPPASRTRPTDRPNPHRPADQSRNTQLPKRPRQPRNKDRTHHMKNLTQNRGSAAPRRPLNKARFRAPERSGHFRDALYSPWSV
jgi:hypothetical protein